MKCVGCLLVITFALPIAMAVYIVSTPQPAAPSYLPNR